LLFKKGEKGGERWKDGAEIVREQDTFIWTATRNTCASVAEGEATLSSAPTATGQELCGRTKDALVLGAERRFEMRFIEKRIEVKGRCKLHPRYKVIKRPRSECIRCWELYMRSFGYWVIRKEV
jgi:hypothetical protein